MSVQGQYRIPAEYGQRVRFTDEGERVCLFPCFGDTMNPIG